MKWGRAHEEQLWECCDTRSSVLDMLTSRFLPDMQMEVSYWPLGYINLEFREKSR